MSEELNTIIHQEIFLVNRFCSISSNFHLKIEHISLSHTVRVIHSFQFFIGVNLDDILFRTGLYRYMV